MLAHNFYRNIIIICIKLEQIQCVFNSKKLNKFTLKFFRRILINLHQNFK